MYSEGQQPASARRRVRDPVRTREGLLRAAFAEMHRSGFRGSDLETILERAGVTKGAMYHHFAGKQAIGYAVVDEVIAALTRAKWQHPLAHAADPVATLIDIIANPSRELADLGCPLNNLTQEMSSLDEGFRTRTATIIKDWSNAVAAALRRGQAQGLIAPSVDPEDEAIFLVAAYQGYIALAKNARDPAILRTGARRLVQHVESLRTKRRRAR